MIKKKPPSDGLFLAGIKVSTSRLQCASFGYIRVVIKSTFGLLVFLFLFLFLFRPGFPLLSHRPSASSHLLNNTPTPRLRPIHSFTPHNPRATAIRRVIRRIHRLVVLDRVVLDFLPHLLDGAVERLVCLVLHRDEVVRVVRGFVAGAAGLGCWCVSGGGGG